MAGPKTHGKTAKDSHDILKNDTAEKKKLREAGKEFAAKTISASFRNSQIEDKSFSFPIFDWKEIVLGKVLGKGGFGTVYEVRGFETDKSSKLANHEEESPAKPNGAIDTESRQFIAEHCLRGSGDSRYALKILSPEVVGNPPTFIQGIMDVATETRILSGLSPHPNIIKLRAIANATPFQETYFLVMDRLYDTLEKRMDAWAKRMKRLNSVGGKFLLDRSGDKKRELLEEKMVAAFDLCAAVGHLHDHNILYRDLKPENVGFDIRDDIKIFDMGLAKEITVDHKRDQNGLYKLTAMTGSPRYMAPEVANDQPYDFRCDTYSFAILFWQMYSDKVPFELYGMKSLKSRVWGGERKRPWVPDDWPSPVKTLLRRAWSHDIQERPRFSQLYTILKNECVRIRDGNADGLEHTRRRSTFVFRGANRLRQSVSSHPSSRRISGASHLTGGTSRELAVLKEEENGLMDQQTKSIIEDRCRSPQFVVSHVLEHISS